MPSHLSHHDEIDKFVIEVNFSMTKRPLSSNRRSSVTKYLRHSWWPDPSLKAMPRGMATPAADVACGDTLAGDVAPPWMLTWHHHGCWRGTTLFSHMSHFYWATCLFFYYIGKCIAFHYYTMCQTLRFEYFIILLNSYELEIWTQMMRWPSGRWVHSKSHASRAGFESHLCTIFWSTIFQQNHFYISSWVQ